MLQRLLLLPLLAPLLAVLLVAAFNPTPTRLRLLIWTSPALPIGAWMALAASGGAALSAGLTALALQQSGDQPLRRRSVQPLGARDRRESEPWEEMPEPEARRQRHQPPTDSAGPERAPQDPPPTLSVPFRILRTGSGDGPAGTPAAATPSTSPDAEGWEVPAGDDW